MKNTKFVTYEQFGAVGDGKTNDFAAICATHDYANENHLPVKAEAGKTYYISDTHVNGAVRPAVIKTNTDWRGASFVIDDSQLSVHTDGEVYGVSIFSVQSYYEPSKVTDPELLSGIIAKGFGPETRKIDLKLGYSALIVPYNNNHKIYRRRGYNKHEGTAMREIMVIDGEGNISEETPLMFEYPGLDFIEVYRFDDEPLLIEGGRFTTIASDINCVVFDENGRATAAKQHYFERNLYVKRSHTTVRGVEHYVEGEISYARQKAGEVGAAYHGFFSAKQASYVTFEDCVMSARRCYHKTWSPVGRGGATGTYDLSGWEVNKLVFKNCTQHNFWVAIRDGVIVDANPTDPDAVLSLSPICNDEGKSARMFWGIGGSNLCKNMEYIGCTLSRFDAHNGLYNGKIIDSTLVAIALTGGGDMHIENTTVYSENHYKQNNIFGLRGDYGSVWNGRITFKNFKAYVYTDKSTSPNAPAYREYAPSKFMSIGYANWDYGYRISFPDIDVDGMTLYDMNTRELINPGHEVPLTTSVMVSEPGIHLENTLYSPPYYCDVDYDGDGFVDGTNVHYDDVVETAGVCIPDSRKNINRITPPKKVRFANCNFDVVVWDTSALTPDGGFFGGTKFYYGNGEDDYYLGTGHKDTCAFKFRECDIKSADSE